MEYLFFDIECAGVFKNVAKICAFGYCLVDEQFHILDKQDILINPKGNFHLMDRKGEQGIVLPYKYEDFKTYPTFPELSKRIYNLLQAENRLVVGHASMNDVKYLNLESKRFSLPSFAFEFADTQFLYMNQIGDFSRQFGLGAIAQNLGVEFTPHRAVDDAYATMKVAEAMCKKENLSLPALIKKYQITLGSIDNYQVQQTTSVGFAAFKAEREKKKEAREKARAAFHIFADRAKRQRAKDGVLKNKRVCFSHLLELEQPFVNTLLTAAFAQGALVSFRAEECDVYVCLATENDTRKASAERAGAKVYAVDAFKTLVGVDA